MKLSTSQGFNVYAVLVPAMGIIELIPAGPWKYGLLALVLVSLMVTGYITRGSGLTEDQGKEILDVAEAVQAALKQDRE